MRVPAPSIAEELVQRNDGAQSRSRKKQDEEPPAGVGGGWESGKEPDLDPIPFHA